MSEPKPPRTSRRRFLRQFALGAVGGPLVLGTYVWRIEPHWVRVVHHELPIAHLPAALEGRVIAHISDLHVGDVVDDNYLRSALRRVLAAEPAAVLVTGDWMTCFESEQVAKAVDTAKELRPEQTPVFTIMGNHDYGMGYRHPHVADEISEGLRGGGVQVLRNECLDFRGLQVAGTDDLWSGRCRVKQTLGQIDPQKAMVTLTHNPDAVDQPGWDRFRGWVLAGHTHGGQCWAPGIGAPIAPIRNRRYIAGEVDLGDGRRLYVNRGLGYKHRVRFLVRPEITLMRLTRDNASV